MSGVSLALVMTTLLGQLDQAPAAGSSPGSLPAGDRQTTRSASSSAPVGLTAVEEEEIPVAAVQNRPRFEVGTLVEIRSGYPQNTSVRPETNLELHPVLAGRLPLGPGGITLAYDPRIFIVAGGSGQDHGYYLHQARLTLDTQTPRARFFFNAHGGYGEYDFLPLSTVLPPSGGTLPPPQQPGSVPTTQPTPTGTPSRGSLPDQRFVNVVSVDGSGGLVYAISRRVSWLASAGYTWAGGADVTARQAYPLHKGPQASTGPIWAMTPRDTLAALIDASYTSFSSGPTSTIVDLSNTWTRSWSQAFQTDLVAGVSGFRSSAPQRSDVSSIRPLAGFAIRQSWIRPRGGLRNTLQFLASPQPDPVSGEVYERLAANLASTWAVNEHLSFDISGAAAMTVSGPQRDVRVEARISYAFAPELLMSLGGRAAWLEGSNLLGPSGFGWIGFLNLTTFVGSPL